jgi:hypothetical protein
MPGVQRLAGEYGIPVIEDAAQASGGTLNGTALGAFGDASVLSFGRGKGTTAGSGGALLARTPGLSQWAATLPSALQSRSRGGTAVLSLLAQRLFSEPLLYNIPASIPMLRLGEMIYHPPQQPCAMTIGSAAVLEVTLSLALAEREARLERARNLLSAIRVARDVTPARALPGGESGYLRLAILDSTGARESRPDLGVLRGYPMTLDQHPQLRSVLHAGEIAGPGSRYLKDRLFTVPTHARVGHAYQAELVDWLTVDRLPPRFVPVVS